MSCSLLSNPLSLHLFCFEGALLCFDAPSPIISAHMPTPGYASLRASLLGVSPKLIHVQLGRSGQAGPGSTSPTSCLYTWNFLIVLVLFGHMELEAMLEGVLMSAHLLNLHVLTAKVNSSEGHERCNDAFAVHPWHLKDCLIYLLWARFLSGGLEHLRLGLGSGVPVKMRKQFSLTTCLLEEWMMTDAEGCPPEDRLPAHLRHKPLRSSPRASRPARTSSTPSS